MTTSVFFPKLSREFCNHIKQSESNQNSKTNLHHMQVQLFISAVTVHRDWMTFRSSLQRSLGELQCLMLMLVKPCSYNVLICLCHLDSRQKVEHFLYQDSDLVICQHAANGAYLLFISWVFAVCYYKYHLIFFTTVLHPAGASH